MRRFLFGTFFLLSAPALLFSQTMRMTPDSGYSGEQMSVSIVGIGTHFESTNNVSGISVILEHSGSIYYEAYYASLLNDSTIAASIEVPSALQVGDYYDLVVKITDTAVHTFQQDSALRVIVSPPSIANVSPTAAYNTQSTAIQIYGRNTNFLSGSSPSISFQRNGTTYFTAQIDTIYGATEIGATVTIPGGTPSGSYYNIIVHNGNYSDTGINKFSSLGPAPTTAHVPMRMTPDSGYQQEQLPVTIVGSGTHFASQSNMSMMAVMFEHSGNEYAGGSYVSVVNDSTMHASIEVPNAFPVGSYYDLVVQITDSTQHTYIQDSAFLVVAPPPSIVSVNPSSAHDSQTVSIQITGQSTDFLSGTIPTVSFGQNGTTYFTGRSVIVSSNTSIGDSVTVPAGVAAGAYDVIVQNGSYSDTGKGKFTVLGPMPTVAIIPDSGAASTEFGVTIAGQYTNFAPTTNISEPLPMSIDLKANGISYYHVTADTVFSTVRADAVFSLPDTLTPGTYDAEIHGNTYTGGSYDYYTTFLVNPHPIITPDNHNLPRADVDTVNLTGSGVNFISGTQEVTTVKLVKEDPDTITASKVTVTSNTTLTAVFAIPADASPGFYDIDITEPGTGRIVTEKNEIAVEGIIVDTNVGTVTPNSGKQEETVTMHWRLMTPRNMLEDSVTGLYLQKGSTIISGSVLTGDTTGSIQIPSDAELGLYDVGIIRRWSDNFDTIIVPNSFTVESASDVSTNPMFLGLVNGLHVSPNPTQDNLTISFMLNSPTHLRLRLFDALGRTVATLCDRNLGAGAQHFEWSARALPAG
ncbi:MAG TPA: hypothetical protein VFH95_00130, partial [Candidatus Kapabacteria bacterium]|nr:hypothetical protein [Candidatus Kapabacteria bacterium]